MIYARSERKYAFERKSDTLMSVNYARENWKCVRIRYAETQKADMRVRISYAQIHKNMIQRYNEEGKRMKPFYTIAVPHEDILEGRLTMDVFAADLWEVSQNRGPEEYKDSDLFFRKTYLTEGLESLSENSIFQAISFIDVLSIC